MATDHCAKLFNLDLVLHLLQKHHFHVAAFHEIALNIKYIGDTARHTCCKVAARSTKHNNTSSSHILASMIAHTFNDDVGPGITNCKALSGNTADVCFTTGRTIE
ncbi:hypothetical protein D3C78_1595710 [compost metagenome]